MSANTGGNLRRTNAIGGFVMHKLLYDTVFQRMIANDYQPALVAEETDCLAQRRFQIFQFAVYGNTDGLESAGSR